MDNEISLYYVCIIRNLNEILIMNDSSSFLHTPVAAFLVIICHQICDDIMTSLKIL